MKLLEDLDLNGNDLVNRGNEPAGGGGEFLIANTGRVYCYADSRWITDSDDNYGPAYYQFTESGTTAVDPVIEWEHRGFMIPAGTTIKSLHLVGRTNNNEIDEIEVYGFIRTPNPITRWETGYDNDGEDTITDLFRDNFWDHSTQGIFTGNRNDQHLRVFDFDDYEVTDHSFLSLFFKPNNTGTATRYFTCGYTWICSR